MYKGKAFVKLLLSLPDFQTSYQAIQWKVGKLFLYNTRQEERTAKIFFFFLIHIQECKWKPLHGEKSGSRNDFGPSADIHLLKILSFSVAHCKHANINIIVPNCREKGTTNAFKNERVFRTIA